MAVDVSGLLSSIEAYAGAVGEVVRDELETTTKEAAPVKTGELRDEITVTVGAGGGSVDWTVDSPADYSSYTDEGTEAHPIVGNPLLAFDWPEAGGTVIVHSVMHPGTTGTHWFDEAMPDRFQQALDLAAATVEVS